MTPPPTSSASRSLTQQLELELPRARRGDPDTSHEAADSVRNIRASQTAIMRTIAELGGAATDEQIAAAYTGPPRQSASGMRTRRCELVARGLVRDSGARVRNQNRRRAIVWELAR